MSEESQFCIQAPSILTEAPIQVPIIGSSHYFSLTPFPVSNPKVPTLTQPFQKINVTKINEICDIYHPFDLNEFNQTQTIYSPKLSQKTYLILLEISHKMVNSGAVKEFCQRMRGLAKTKASILITILAYGHNVYAPIFKKDRNSFFLSTLPDISDNCPLIPEMVYFDLNIQSELFEKYLDLLENLEPETMSFSYGSIIEYFFDFIKDLRNPTLIISSETSDASDTQIEQIIESCKQPHVSFELALFGDVNLPNISKLVKETNTHIRYYGFSQVQLLFFDLIDLIQLPYVRFCCLYAIGTDSVHISKCIGNYCTCIDNRYIFNKLIAGDTMHFFVDIDRNKAKKVPPEIRFVVQYFDANVVKYKRIIPIKIIPSNDSYQISRTLSMNAIVGAAASILAFKTINNEQTEELRNNFEISLKSDYFRTVLDQGTFERLKIAANALKLATTQVGAHEILSRTDEDIFDLLSPLCIFTTNPQQRTILFPDVFRNGSVAIQQKSQYFLCYDEPGTPSTVEITDQMGKCPYLDGCKDPTRDSNYHYWLLAQVMNYVF